MLKNSNEVKGETKENKPRLKKGLIIAANVVSWAILGFLALIVIANIVMTTKSDKGDPFPTFLGYANARIASGSMSPTMEVNDIVIVHSESSYKIGEVITFKTSTMPVTHRIVGIGVNSSGEECYRTKGDYVNNSIDQDEGDFEKYIPKSAVYGKVILTLRNGTAVLSFFKSPIGIVIILTVGGLVVSLPYIINYLIERRNRKKESDE